MTCALAGRFFAEQDRLRGGPAAELCAPGYSAHLPGAPPLDCAGHQAFAAAFYAAFPDLRHEVELIAAQEGQMGIVVGILWVADGEGDRVCRCDVADNRCVTTSVTAFQTTRGVLRTHHSRIWHAKFETCHIFR